MQNRLKRYRKWYEDGIISYNTYCQKCQEYIDEEMKKLNQNIIQNLKNRLEKRG